MERHDDLRLIEAGFPCHQVGAETQRERGSSNGCRRFTPACLVGQATADTQPSALSSRRSIRPEPTLKALSVSSASNVCRRWSTDDPWTLTGKLLERSTHPINDFGCPSMTSLVAHWRTEQEIRRTTAQLIHNIQREHDELRLDPDMQRWEEECRDLPFQKKVRDLLLPSRLQRAILRGRTKRSPLQNNTNLAFLETPINILAPTQISSLTFHATPSFWTRPQAEGRFHSKRSELGTK